MMEVGQWTELGRMATTWLGLFLTIGGLLGTILSLWANNKFLTRKEWDEYGRKDDARWTQITRMMGKIEQYMEDRK